LQSALNNAVTAGAITGSVATAATQLATTAGTASAGKAAPTASNITAAGNTSTTNFNTGAQNIIDILNAATAAGKPLDAAAQTALAAVIEQHKAAIAAGKGDPVVLKQLQSALNNAVTAGAITGSVATAATQLATTAGTASAGKAAPTPETGPGLVPPTKSVRVTIDGKAPKKVIRVGTGGAPRITRAVTAVVSDVIKKEFNMQLIKLRQAKTPQTQIAALQNFADWAKQKTLDSNLQQQAKQAIDAVISSINAGGDATALVALNTTLKNITAGSLLNDDDKAAVKIMISSNK
jgi:hypothetical protein